MKHSLIILAALAVSGCAFDGQFQNRVTTTLDCKRGFLASLYGPLGVTAEIDKADVDVICAKAQAAAPAASAAK